MYLFLPRIKILFSFVDYREGKTENQFLFLMKEFFKYCNFLPSDKICLSFKNICLLYSAKNAPYGLTVGGVFIIDLH